MDTLNDEFIRLISAFNSNKVKYLLVGGIAVNQYGYNRSTSDVDFWIKDDLDNRNNLVKAFEDLDYGTFQELMTTPFIPGFCEIYLNNGIYADLLSEIHGYNQKNFEECYEKGRIIQIQEEELRFISYQDLIISKSKSNRPKDLLDVEELKRINK